MNDELAREREPVEANRDGDSRDHDRRTVGFSLMWTVVSTAIVIMGIGLLAWSYDSLTSLENVENPERALSHIASRSMDLESMISQASTWEQALYRAFNGEDDGSTQLMTWYQELADESQDPLVSLYAAVFEAETENLKAMNERLQAWHDLDEPYTFFRQLLEAAYGTSKLDLDTWTLLQAHLAEEVPNNWFYRRLAVQLAQRVDNLSFIGRTQAQQEQKLQNLFLRNRLLLFVEIGVVLLSVIALVSLLVFCYRKGSDCMQISHAALPPPWLGRDGFAVLVRGGALTFLLLTGLGAVLGAYLSLVANTLNAKLMELVSALMLYAPIPILVYVYLLRPKGRSVGDVFGLRLLPQKKGFFFLVVFSLFAGGLLGDVVISLGGEAMGKSTHWTEWFNDSLVWGGVGELAILFFEVVVMAPLFEEFIFRGMVFGSFRRHLGWLPSAFLSAMIFAVVHGYGLVGFCAVAWSGFLWAWAYEKTGSLIPGILAHAMNNLVFFVNLLVVFR